MIERDGDVIEEIAGTTSWTQYSVPVVNLFNNIEISLSSLEENPDGERRFWVDGMTFTPDPDALKPVLLNVNGRGNISFKKERWKKCRKTCYYYPEPVEGQHSLIVTPDDGYEFIGWGGDCRGTNLECTVNADKYRDIYAYFTKETAPLDAKSLSNALNNDNLYFHDVGDEYWIIRDEGSSGSTSLRTSQIDRRTTFTLATSISGSGRLTFDYKLNANVDAGDTFKLIINGRSVDLSSNSDNWITYSAESPGGEHSIKWQLRRNGEENEQEDYFVAIDNVQWTGEPGAQKTIDLNIVGGRGAVRTSHGDYCRDSCRISVVDALAGSRVRLYAEANNVAEFVRWEGACSGLKDTCTFDADTIDALTVTAIFENDSRTVFAHSGDGGIATPAKQDVVVGESGQVNLIPYVGHAIQDVWGCGGTRSGNTFTTAAIFETCEVFAEFKPLEYNVTFDLGEYGEHIGGGALEQRVLWGENAEAPELEPFDDWHFAGWSESFTKVTRDLAVDAIYQEVEGALRVNLSVSDNAHLSRQSVQYIQPKTSLTVEVMPDVGYQVSRTVNGTCPKGDWNKNYYTIPSITETCTAQFSATSVLKSGSLLLILSAESESKE